MELNASTLYQCFLDTLSPLPDPRHRAESFLAAAANQPNYAVTVLHLVAEPSVDDHIRQAAAVNFKNHIRSRWSSSSATPIANSEKVQIKDLIVPLMLFAPSRIQSQISEALAIISSHDFPKLWPELLPGLIENLGNAAESSDYASVNGILGAANLMFKKFRYQYTTDDFLLDLKYCLVNFAEPLLKIFKKTATLIDNAVSSGSGTAVTLRLLFESQKLCCRIFYSLNFQILPEFFEDHMEEWMIEFQKYLTTSYPTLEKSGGPDGLALVDELRAAVCENINLYIERNEDEFEGYLKGFASAVWSLLGDVTQSSSRDRLAITAIKFLTTLSMSVHHRLFEEEETILRICQSIVIPNVRLREDDEDLFQTNYVEFIRRDMEGSDLDTRRRIACELVKGIAAKYKGKVKDIVSLQIRSLLSSFAANPAANWKDKDCAIYMYLVVSLAMKRAGDCSASADSVDVENFFVSVVVPELTSQSVNEFPMLKACALKFFTMFRSQIQKSIALQLLPDLVRFLTSESTVVHSYAASCIEKLLLVKDEWGRPRYASEDIDPVLLMLMNNLFHALTFPESKENQYVMKCIMRVLGVADITQGIAAPSIAGLKAILSEVCKNPKNPVFNHYLFESVAILVRRACEKDAALISTFEANLFPSLQTILTNDDVAEFLPYAFQVLALLVELNSNPIPQSYLPIFGTLLLPEVWNRGPNVPALVRLLRAFLQKSPHELKQGGCLDQVLGIFDMLIASSSTEEQGFYVLNTVIENLEYGVIGSYMDGIWRALFTRLQRKQTVKFIKSLLIFMSLFLVKHGSANLVDSMNAVQPDIFVMILEEIWIPKLKLITGHIETKLTAVASTRLLCKFPVLLDAAAATRNWGKMLDSISILLSRPEEDRVEKEPEMPDIAENAGYTATFVNLYNAVKKEEDPLKDIRDPKEFLVASLAGLSASSPGRHPQIIVESLEAANQTQALQQP